MSNDFPEKCQVLFDSRTGMPFVVAGKQDIENEVRLKLTSQQSGEEFVISAQNLQTHFTESPPKDDFRTKSLFENMALDFW